MKKGRKYKYPEEGSEAYVETSEVQKCHKSCSDPLLIMLKKWTRFYLTITNKMKVRIVSVSNPITN